MANIEWFEKISIDDVPHVGGKNASLGEMYRELQSQGVKVPNGFATTAEAFRDFIRVNELESTIAEILESRNEKVEEGSIFYVRTVRDGDVQGIWGIVHQGILQNFARGVALRRGEELNTYKVDIPPDADELEQDRSSSFLGRLIYDKSRESHVYNYRLNRMGESPDRIYPGQELVIIQFRAEELV